MSFLLTALFLLSLSPTLQDSISDVTVLLPFKTKTGVSVSFELSTDSGECYCFQAEDTRVISIRTPESTGSCTGGSSTSVFISPEVQSVDGRKDSSVFGQLFDPSQYSSCDQMPRVHTDSDFTDILQSEVFVDSIKKIELLSNTKVVNIGEIESLEIQAFDESGNVFSSVMGLPFRWKIQHDDALINVPLAHSGKVVDEVLIRKEKEGIISSAYCVKGKEKTKTKVTVGLDPSLYDYVPYPIEAIFVVVEPMYLTPREVFLLPNDEFQLTLTTSTKSSGHRRPIDLPSPHYIWKSSSKHVQVDSVGKVTTKSLGNAKVSVEASQYEKHRKSTDVRVVDVKKLEIVISRETSPGTYEEIGVCGGKNTRLVSGVNYRAQPRAFDKRRNLITLTKNSGVTVYFEDGKEAQSAALYRDFMFPNTEIETVTLHSALRTMRAKCVLPIDSPVMPSQSYASLPHKIGSETPTLTLSANGGSGKGYTWKSHDPLVSVKNGEITVNDDTALLVRNVQVVVSDMSNPFNSAGVTVKVSLPKNLRLHRSAHETEVGKSLDLKFSVSDWSGQPFTQCESLSLSTVATGSYYEVVNSRVACETTAGGNVFNVRVSALQQGLESVTSALSHRSSMKSPSNAHWSENYVLSAFKGIALFPSSIALRSGMSAEISWENGPIDWSEDGEAVMPILDSAHKNPVSLGQVDYEHRKFTVKCGSTDIVQKVNEDISLTNSPTQLNPVTFSSKAKLSVECIPDFSFTSSTAELHLGESRVLESVKPKHPLQDRIQYLSSNPSVVSVDVNGNVTALELGTAKITAFMDDLESAAKTGLKSVIEVSVQFSDFRIKTGGRLLIGEEMVAYVVSGENQNPNKKSFRRVHCEWSANTQTIALLPTLAPRSEDLKYRMHESLSGLSVRILALKEASDVQLMVKCSVDSIMKEGSTRINVERPLLPSLGSKFVLLPPNGCTGLFHARSQGATPHNTVIYNKNKEQVAAESFIDESKRRLCVLDEEDNYVVVVSDGSQSVTASVQVREPASIGYYRLDYSELDTALCVGKSANISVYLQDELGRRFLSANSNGLDVQVTSYSTGPDSNKDVIRTDLKSQYRNDREAVEIFALSPGTAMVEFQFVNGGFGGNVEPTYMQIEVVSGKQCRMQCDVFMSNIVVNIDQFLITSFRVASGSLPKFISDRDTFSSRLGAFEKTLIEYYASLLGISNDVIHIRSLDLNSGVLELVFVPPEMTGVEDDKFVDLNEVEKKLIELFVTKDRKVFFSGPVNAVENSLETKQVSASQSGFTKNSDWMEPLLSEIDTDPTDMTKVGFTVVVAAFVLCGVLMILRPGSEFPLGQMDDEPFDQNQGQNIFGSTPVRTPQGLSGSSYQPGNNMGESQNSLRNRSAMFSSPVGQGNQNFSVHRDY